jgi:peptide-methionine (S)-S-oxide reductase
MSYHWACLQGTVVTEIEPVQNFTMAEPHHQQYLSSGGRFGQPQSPAKVQHLWG